MIKNEFRKYQHIERFGTTEVEGINIGTCYVFPKIDGTNASVWINDNKIQAGSRKRHLSLDDDNTNFYEWVLKQDNLKQYLLDNPTHRLFGEWLVSHTLKTYRDDAWHNFYVFDVTVSNENDNFDYLRYPDYSEKLEKYNIKYISPICVIKDPSYDTLIKQLTNNTFLIKDNSGVGEGIVVKNYDFVNKYGRRRWAKIVSNEFKDSLRKKKPTIIKGKFCIEDNIVNKYVTKSLCDKVYSKIKNDNKGFSNKDIPRLLNTVYYDLIKEDCWDFVKKFKNPIIDFGKLQRYTFLKVRSNLPEIFG